MVTKILRSIMNRLKGVHWWAAQDLEINCQVVFSFQQVSVLDKVFKNTN